MRWFRRKAKLSDGKLPKRPPRAINVGSAEGYAGRLPRMRRKPKPITSEDAKAALRVMGIVDVTDLQADVLARIANGHDPLEAAFFARHDQPESQRRDKRCGAAFQAMRSSGPGDDIGYHEAAVCDLPAGHTGVHSTSKPRADSTS